MIPIGAKQARNSFYDALLSNGSPNNSEEWEVDDLLARASVCNLPHEDVGELHLNDGERPWSRFHSFPPISGSQRCIAGGVLFGDNSDEWSIAVSIRDVIAKCPIDIRPLMVQNICVAGGLASLSNFHKRCEYEVVREINKKNESLAALVSVPCPLLPPLISTWCGGSLASALGTWNQILTASSGDV